MQELVEEQHDVHGVVCRHVLEMTLRGKTT